VSLPPPVGADSSVVGSAKLELEYNDLNPDRPVLLVKLLDILLQSSKNLSSGQPLEIEHVVLGWALGGATTYCNSGYACGLLTVMDLQYVGDL